MIMPFIQWEESFETGIKQFDDHHQQLVDLLNTTYDNIICQAPYERLGNILDELVDYTIFHFGSEEAWLIANSYPKFYEHKREHESFFQKVQVLQDGYHDGKISISIDMLTLLRNWLKDHILVSDAEYGRFRSEKG
jgi:hemerythrin-like metal-binding protein